MVAWKKWLAVLCAALIAAPSDSESQQAPTVVASIAIDAPGSSQFVLRCTLPLPPGTYPRQDGLVPLAILNHNGTPVPTQIETVSSYPRDVDGADVVELMAVVDVPPGTASGARLSYAVAQSPHARVYSEPGAIAKALMDAPGQITLLGNDVFGHAYEAPLWVPGRKAFGDGVARLERNGAGARTVRISTAMLSKSPNVGPPDGALPHLFLVNSYVTAWANQDVITIDMRVHNGPSNHDKTLTDDDIIGDTYYESLRIRIPKGWTLLQQGPDPLFGATTHSGEWTEVAIVEPQADGSMHFFPSQGQFHRRFALCKIGSEVDAARYLAYRHLGFCQDGTAAGGARYWSWWNPATARYFPQRYPLPNLGHVGVAAKQKVIDGVLIPLMNALANGTKATSGQIATPRIGYAHPWGAPYGGVTGGTEIWMFDGIVTADLASQTGYLLAALTHRTYQDRQPDVLFNRNGNPTALEDWLKQGPNGLYSGMLFYEELKDGPDPFGFDEADPFQFDHVTQNALGPLYEATLRGYQPIDTQHLSRTTRSMKVLAWLGNDPLAKDDLRMRSEIFRLGFHQYNNLPNGAPSGLKGLTMASTNHPGKGLNIGRGQGWGLDATNAAYCFGDAAYRQTLLPWYQQFTDALDRGQFTCNGFIMSKDSPKVLGGKYNARQQYEHAILENSWRGALETVLRGVDQQRTVRMEKIIATSVNAMISPMSWDPAQKGPWGQLAVAPLDINAEPFCNPPYPPGNTSTGVDKYQCPSSFAYGYAISKDPAILTKAGEFVGGDLKTKMQGYGLANLENRAALLTLSQQQ